MRRSPDVAQTATRTKGHTLTQPGAFQESNSAWEGFQVHSLLVGSAPLRGSYAGTSLSWRFSGKGQQGGYDRRFETAIGEVQLIDVSPYTQWEVELLRLPTVQGLRGWVCASEGFSAGSRPSRLTLAENYTAGTHAVPPGATKLYPASASAGFQWDAITAANVALAIPQALAVGQELEVKGTHFTVVGAVSLIWEIWL